MSAQKKINVFQAAAIYRINKWTRLPRDHTSWNNPEVLKLGLYQRLPYQTRFGKDHFIPIAARFFRVHRSTIYRHLQAFESSPHFAADTGDLKPLKYDALMANPALARHVTRWYRRLVKYYCKQKEMEPDNQQFYLRFRQIIDQFPGDMWEALYELAYTHHCSQSLIRKVGGKLGMNPDDAWVIVEAHLHHGGFGAPDRTKINSWKIKCAEWGAAWALADILRGDHPSAVPKEVGPPSSRRFRLSLDALVPPANSKGDVGRNGENPPAGGTAVA